MFVKIYFCILAEIFGKATLEVIILEILKGFLLFFLGGSAYVSLEWLWRGWSNISMFFAGGVCFLLLGKLNAVRPRLNLPLRGFVGAGIITMVELATGLLCNRSYQVWDYRHMPFNLGGQICLRFFLLWMLLSLPAMGLYTLADRMLSSFLESIKGRR